MSQLPHEKNPQTIEDILQLEGVELQRRAEKIELPSPEQLATEELFLQALTTTPRDAAYAQEAEKSDDIEESNAPKRGWRAFVSMFFAPQWAWAASACALVAVVWWGGSPYAPWYKPHTTWSSKGTEPPPTSAENEVGLHIGTWDSAQKRFQQIVEKTRCRRTQSLVFGFTLAKPGGYVYLFRLMPGNPTLLLYPFQPHRSVYWKSRKALRLLRDNGVVQQYQLAREHGPIQFAFLQTQTPLRKEQLQPLQQSSLSLSAFLSHLRTLKATKQLMAKQIFALYVEE